MKNYHKTYIIFLFFILLLIAAGTLKAQSWLWADSSGGFGHYDGIVSNGNCYICGGIEPNTTIHFGKYSLRNNNIISDSWESFLVKYNSKGDVEWAKQSIVLC